MVRIRREERECGYSGFKIGILLSLLVILPDDLYNYYRSRKEMHFFVFVGGEVVKGT